jgi:hypothetical protein
MHGLQKKDQEDFDLIKKLNTNRLHHFRLFLLNNRHCKLSTNVSELCHHFFEGGTWFGVTDTFVVSSYSLRERTIQNEKGEVFPVELLGHADYLTFKGDEENLRFSYGFLQSLFWDLRKVSLRAKTISLINCGLPIDSIHLLLEGSPTQKLYFYNSNFYVDVESWFGTRLKLQTKFDDDYNPNQKISQIEINSGSRIHPFMVKWATRMASDVYTYTEDGEKTRLEPR